MPFGFHLAMDNPPPMPLATSALAEARRASGLGPGRQLETTSSRTL